MFNNPHKNSKQNEPKECQVSELRSELWQQALERELVNLPVGLSASDELERKGNYLIAGVLIKHPELTEPLVRYLALFFLKAWGYAHTQMFAPPSILMENITQTNALSFVKEELVKSVRMILSRLRERETSIWEDPFLTCRAALLLEHISGLGASLEIEERADIANLFLGAVACLKKDRFHKIEQLRTITRGLTRLHLETQGSFNIEPMFEQLAKYQGCDIVSMEAALKLNREVPELIRVRFTSFLESRVKNWSNETYFPNADWFCDALRILRDVFDRLEAYKLRLETTKHLCEVSNSIQVTADIQKILGRAAPVKAQATIGRLMINDEVFEIPAEEHKKTSEPTEYIPIGAFDYVEAARNLTTAGSIDLEEFWELAGDQAILSLGGIDQDALAVEAQISGLLKNSWEGSQLMAQITQRFSRIEKFFPESERAIRAWAKLLEAVILEGTGETVGNFAFHIQSSIFTPEEKIRLIEAELIYHTEEDPIKLSAQQRPSNNMKQPFVGVLLDEGHKVLGQPCLNFLTDKAITAASVRLKASITEMRSDDHTISDELHPVVEARKRWALESEAAKRFFGIKT